MPRKSRHFQRALWIRESQKSAVSWGYSQSGCRDLNPGPLDPQSSALTKLRHSPQIGSEEIPGGVLVGETRRTRS